jgi:GNAT superfamily N-acetyltransferase
MIEIRRAQPGDGAALGEVHAASWAASHAVFFQPEFAERAVRDRRTRWHGRIAAGNGLILVADVDGRLMALSYSLPSPTRPGLAEIYSFYCHPDGWGQGIAKALMIETLAQLDDQGYPGVHLRTLRHTPQSHRFYAKSGFTESGAETTFDYGDGNPLPLIEYERIGRS